MGSSAARITAADFLTPPELKKWSLAANGAGRIGGVRLELVRSGARTVLGDCYQQVPLRVLPPFPFDNDQAALLYLLNPTAGLMDGDAQLVHLQVGPGSRAVVTGQSATRIHPCLHGFSTQQWHIEVDAGAVLAVLPGPAIPFQGCRYYQRAVVDLAPDAALVWGDIWLAGRYARGAISERFQFETLIQDLTVRRDGRLVFRDRFCWRGPWDETTAAWHFGAAPACASLFASVGDHQTPWPDLPTSAAARFFTAAGDLCCRWLGDSEDVTQGLVDGALRLAAFLSGQAPAEPWLLAHCDLAGNHWFSPAASGSAK
jgi:urease accessory protein